MTTNEVTKITPSTPPHVALPQLIDQVLKVVEKYLDYYNKFWLPNTDNCIEELEKLENEFLQLKKNFKAGKIAGTSINVASGILGAAWCTLGFFSPGPVAELAVGGTTLATAVAGIATQMGIAVAESKKENKVITDCNKFLDGHLYHSAVLDQIMKDFEEKYQQIVDYLSELGIDGQVLLAYYFQKVDGSAFDILRANLNRYKTAFEKNKKAEATKPQYGELVRFLIKISCRLKNFFEELCRQVSKLNAKITTLGTASIAVPSIEVLNNTEALSVGAKVSLGIGIGLNLLAAAASIKDLISAATDDVKTDKVYCMIENTCKDLKTEKECFEKHLESIWKCQRKLNEAKSEIEDFKPV